MDERQHLAGKPDHAGHVRRPEHRAYVQDRRCATRTMWHGAYFVGIDRDGYHRELAAQYLPLIGRIQGEQVLAILKSHREDGVVGLAGARLVAFKCPRLACHHCPAEPMTLIRDHSLRKQVDCIVLIQQRRQTLLLAPRACRRRTSRADRRGLRQRSCWQPGDAQASASPRSHPVRSRWAVR